MNKKYVTYSLTGFVLLITLIIVVDKAEDLLTQVEYPFDVWRMDLDDILANIGLFMVGAAAIWTVKLRGDKLEANHEQLANKINGNLAVSARLHMQEDEIFIGLMHRIDKLENERTDCIDELKVLREKIEEL